MTIRVSPVIVFYLEARAPSRAFFLPPAQPLEKSHARETAAGLCRDARFPVRLPGAYPRARIHDAAGADHEFRVRCGHFAGPDRYPREAARVDFLARARLRARAISDPLHQRPCVVDGAFDVFAGAVESGSHEKAIVVNFIHYIWRLLYDVSKDLRINQRCRKCFVKSVIVPIHFRER